MTGFYVFEPTLGAKLLELLKEIAPHVTRVAILSNQLARPGSWTAYAVYAADAAPRFGVELVEVPVRDSSELEAAMDKWGRDPNFGVIVIPDPATNAHRKLINELATRYRLPVIHALRAGAAEGGLLSYGVNLPNLFRQAAVYADRILKGEKPSDLPVQAPTKYELAINLRTAKALGMTIPQSLLATADDVIE